MNMVDIIATYLYGLRYIALLLMILLLIFAIDDLIIDIYYWTRRCWRFLTIYRHRPVFNEQQLFTAREQPLAIMVPAWNEVGVIGKMAEFAATELDYENYQIFVGTYPNDPATQADVDAVCQRFPNVHKVVCVRPGPTSKADCLNNIIASILEFERQSHIKFAGFVLHDAEDVVSAMELRLFNYLLPRKDLIQLPVYPFVSSPLNFTAGHYLDEFAEMHGKDVVVREAMVGQVPSAGVGTCFSRRAMLKLSAEGAGLPFDVRSLTEDYDIGYRLKQWGLEEIFVRFSVTDKQLARYAETSRSRAEIAGNVVCVREYFPSTFKAAIRQKSRWIIGIVFQGFKTHRWSLNWKLNYFLWRDRKGVISYFVSFLSTLIFVQLCLLWLYDLALQYTVYSIQYRFLSIFAEDPLIIVLLWLNLLFFLNRLLQRMIFVWHYYGVLQALLSVPRQLWGNIINFFANVRAIRQVWRQGDLRRVAWDKTDHQYPTMSERRSAVSLGSILVQQGVLSEPELILALEQQKRGERLGHTMLRLELVTPQQLATALARQAGVELLDIDPFALPETLISNFPARLALKYSVLPVAVTPGELLLIRESVLSPVALAAMERQLKCRVRYQICLPGVVTLGLRYWYKQDHDCNPQPQLRQWQAENMLSAEQASLLKQQYFSCQLPFGEALLQAALLEPAVVNQVLLGYQYDGQQRLGEYLVQEQLLTADVVEQVLSLQQQRQKTIEQLFACFRSRKQEVLA